VPCTPVPVSAATASPYPGTVNRVPNGITDGSTATTPQPAGKPVEVRPASEYPVAVTTSVPRAVGGARLDATEATGVPAPCVRLVSADAVVAALALQTTLARYVRGSVAVNLVLVVVVYVALISGPVTGLLTGTFAGLAQDALATGVIGIGGLAKTLVGFLTGIIGTQFIVAQPLPRFCVFFGATVLHQLVFIGLNTLLDLRHFGSPYAAVAGLAAGNAVVGVVAFQLVELLPGAVERRRAAKGRIRR